jgi:hypothetical protein
MKAETLFSFIWIYINRRRIKKLTRQLNKLPRWIFNAGLPQHEKVKLEKTFKLAILQLFKPKSKKEQREFLKS